MAFFAFGAGFALDALIVATVLRAWGCRGPFTGTRKTHQYRYRQKQIKNTCDSSLVQLVALMDIFILIRMTKGTCNKIN
jgi:hypothetical protein